MGCQCIRAQLCDLDTSAMTKCVYIIDKKNNRFISVPYLKPVKTNKMYSSRINHYTESSANMRTLIQNYA